MTKGEWGLLLCALCATSHLHAQDAGVAAQRLSSDQAIVVDGQLTEAAWGQARAYSVGHQFTPQHVQAEIPQTTYRVLVDDKHLYIGVDARDPNPKEIWQALARRDTMSTADIIEVFLDGGGQRKFAQVFRVAAGGAIRDGTFYEESGRFDFAADFAFESATHVGADGWSVELKIPATSLRFNGAGKPTILVTRLYPRNYRFMFASTDIDDQHQCTLCKNPTLEGAQFESGRTFVLTPYVGVTHNKSGDDRSTKGRAGADLKWRLTDSAVVDATLYPDFSQVELDTPQLSANATYALFYPEKRPFFQEGLDLFDTPLRAVYTRTLTKPEWGARITNRSTSTDAVLLTARDEGGGLVLLPGPFATNFANQPEAIAAIGRSRFHVLDSHTGVIAALKDYGDAGDNVVAGADTVYTKGDNRFNAQVLFSRTTALPSDDGLARGEAQSDSAAHLGYRFESTQWFLNTELNRIGDEFRDDSGFIELNGVYGGELFLQRKVTPGFGLSEAGFYGLVEHSRTLDGQTIELEFFPGVELRAPGNSYFEFFWSPVAQRRVAADTELHRYSYGGMVASAAPARWLPNIFLLLEAGERLDSLSDRVGKGYLVRLEPSFLLRSRLRLGFTLSQEQITDEVMGVERTLLRDTAVQGIASYFFNADNELRATYQHNHTFRDEDAFDEPITPRTKNELVSMVYTWNPSLGRAFYAGGTWNHELTGAGGEDLELFVKMSWAF